MLGRAGGFAGLAGPVAFGSVRCGRWRRALSVCLSSPFLLTGSPALIPHPPPSTAPRCLAQKLIFRILQNKSKIKIWLFNNNDLSNLDIINTNTSQNNSHKSSSPFSLKRFSKNKGPKQTIIRTRVLHGGDNLESIITEQMESSRKRG